MIVGFKGDVSKLKKVYEELGLKEIKAENIEELETLIKNADGESVIVNYNDLVVYENVTADIVEKKNKIMKVIKGLKKNLYLGLTKIDSSIDHVKIDVAVETKVNTEDMKVIADLFDFVNSDFSFNGKLDEDKLVVRVSGELRGETKTISELKNIIK